MRKTFIDRTVTSSAQVRQDDTRGWLPQPPIRLLRATAVAAAVCSLAGCFNTGPQSIVHVPTYPPLMNPQTALAQQGSIYQTGTSLALYETPRARHVGDLLTVKLEETFSTSNKATTEASRSSDINAKAADGGVGATRTLARFFNIGTAASDFNGKGTITGNGTLSGTLAVSVIAVLPSGNLEVSGDKIISTNNDQQNVRFSGIVNPIDISMGNTVSSTKIANARIEQVGDGILKGATSQGWLQRLMMGGSNY